jgi:hypothetical protein
MYITHIAITVKCFMLRMTHFCNWQLGPKAYEHHAAGGDPPGQGFPQGSPFGDIFGDVRFIVPMILFIYHKLALG